jgi:molybdenum-dependent DNA-binding transcriptional regulator ModE
MKNYSEKQVLKAVEQSAGSVNKVAEILGSSWKTAENYIYKFENTARAFDKLKKSEKSKGPKNQSNFSKCTQAVKEQRLNKVIRELLKETSRHDIVQEYSKKWDVSIRQVDTYIKEAKDQIVESVKEDRESDIELELKKRDDLYNQSYRQGEFQTCLNIARDKAKLLGLYDRESGADETDLSKFAEELQNNGVRFRDQQTKSQADEDD